MNILIPINTQKEICSLDSKNAFAFVTMKDGTIEKTDFYQTKEEINELIDYIVVENKDEFVSDFFLEGIGILIAPLQKSIEDIVEAYMFRELHELEA